ncbi:MAG: hypothetical protein BGO31_12660 [Bacteroidetes bacterium 43-16]|nr:MAG: hypothetical protein BGO31_12660 [Bacteroidetes bacterium 43-16]
MKYILLFTGCIIALLFESFAQGEDNIWLFGKNYSLDFSQNPPLLRDDRYINNTLIANTSSTLMPNNEHFYDFAQAVADENGQLLFIVKKHVYRNTGLGYTVPAPNIFDRNEEPIAGTEFLSPSDMEEDRPIIVPDPNDPNRYYIFHVRNGGLLYCLFDISLNNGRGDIVPGQKNVLHYGYNTLVGRSMVTVQGCDGVWLILRHKVANQFLSFKVDANGLASVPVISEIGSMANGEYAYLNEFVASPDGKQIALVKVKVDHLNQAGGVELFDFERCNGKLKNSRLFETGQLTYGVGFSPDGSKIYVAYSDSNPVLTPMAFWWRDHNLYQFHLSVNDLTAIVNSKTLIFTNPYVQQDLPFCPLTAPYLGSIRSGKDGKLYFTNGAPRVCSGTGGVGMALHVINSPNLPGLACNPSINAIFNSVNGMSTGNRSSSRTNLPYPLVSAPTTGPDTQFNQSVSLAVCFKNDTILKAPQNTSCLLWSTGSTDTQIVVNASGRYWLRYVIGCDVIVDSFDVNFTELPKVELVQYGCNGYIQFSAGEIGAEPFGLSLHNSLGGKIYESASQSLHSVYNLTEGFYNVKLTSGVGCDSTILVELKAYPAATIIVTPASAEIRFGEEVILQADGGDSYIWTPATGLSSRIEQIVVAKPTESMRYEVVGVNPYGCRDSAVVLVDVVYDKTIRLPNAFTPNGDGLNDFFEVPAGAFTIRRFEIYNRYGQLVFYAKENEHRWDGRFKGADCPADVYYYNLIIDFPDQTNELLKGDVTLLR